MRDPQERAEAEPRVRLARFGERLPDLESRFGPRTALGVISIDASGLAEIERTFGVDAHRRTLVELGALVEELIGEDLGVEDVILAGETGRDEILVLLFRELGEAEFYQRELPAFLRVLREGLPRRANGIGYPYLRKAPPLPMGTSTALRNPTLGGATQLRAALEDARSDAELNTRIDYRERRRQIFDLVIQGSVHSVYEPIVEVESRTVFGYEALARGPQGSDLHSAARLFGAATEMDLLFQLDCLCRQSGLEGARDLPEGTKLFLNVRPTTIHDPNFRGDALQRTLERWNLSPTDMVFEISEQESISNFEIFREVRDYYGKLGFQFALDDTGAGYASLEAVVELSPEFIKVDRAFVSGVDEDPARQELLRALCSVAEQMGARVIGEGLDTLEELETLGKVGIPFGQGWLFGKPHPLRHDL